VHCSRVFYVEVHDDRGDVRDLCFGGWDSCRVEGI
jgi:hypothetical protein